MNKKGILLALSTAVISGISIFINKFGVAFSDPAVFAFLKNLVVSLILLSIILSWKNWREIKKLNARNWIMLLSIGLIGGCIPFILFFKGLTITSAMQGAFIHKTMFLYVAILAVIFLREKINKYFLGGAFLVLAGNLLVIKNLSFVPNSGDFLILLATVFWAVENIISKYALEKIGSDIVAWSRMFFGSLFILGYLAINGQVGLILNLNWEQMGWIAVSSVLLFGYVFTWYRGLSKIPVTIATSILLLGSPITTILTVINIGKINWTEILSTLLMIGGIIVIIAFGHENIKKEERKTIGA